eukprot:419833-Prymnesium_polylepis.2
MGTLPNGWRFKLPGSERHAPFGALRGAPGSRESVPCNATRTGDCRSGGRLLLAAANPSKAGSTGRLRLGFSRPDWPARLLLLASITAPSAPGHSGATPRPLHEALVPVASPRMRRAGSSWCARLSVLLTSDGPEMSCRERAEGVASETCAGGAVRSSNGHGASRGSWRAQGSRIPRAAARASLAWLGVTCCEAIVGAAASPCREVRPFAPLHSDPRARGIRRRARCMGVSDSAAAVLQKAAPSGGEPAMMATAAMLVRRAYVGTASAPGTRMANRTAWRHQR